MNSLIDFSDIFAVYDVRDLDIPILTGPPKTGKACLTFANLRIDRLNKRHEMLMRPFPPMQLTLRPWEAPV